MSTRAKLLHRNTPRLTGTLAVLLLLVELVLLGGVFLAATAASLVDDDCADMLALRAGIVLALTVLKILAQRILVKQAGRPFCLLVGGKGMSVLFS